VIAHSDFLPIMTIAGISMLSVITIIAMLIVLILPANIAFAGGKANTPTTNAILTSPSTGVELFSNPVYRENIFNANITQANQTHAIFTFSGNGSLTPNTNQSVSTISKGTGIISLMTSSGYATETISTQDRTENLTATFYEIVPFNSTTSSNSRGIVIAVFQTNSTGLLASLDGAVAAGVDNITSADGSHIVLWRWQGDHFDNHNNSFTDITPTPPIRRESAMNLTEPTITNANSSERNTDREADQEYFDFFPF
jgi:hypothetical protein